MKTRNILFLVLGLAMIQDQTLVASKHYLVETEDGKGLHSHKHIHTQISYFQKHLNSFKSAILNK